MDILKLAKLFETKVAQVVHATVAEETAYNDTIAKLKQVQALSSTAFNGMDIYDPGYQQVRQLAGSIYTIWQAINSDSLADKLSSDLPTLKKLALESLEFVTGPQKGNIQTLTRILNSIHLPQPVKAVPSSVGPVA